MEKTIKIAGRKIINDVYIADSFKNRLMGYMFKEEPHHKAILIKSCNSIHTFFMKFNIDVIFLNEDMKVIKKIEGLEPGKVIMPIKGAKMVLESSEGVFKDIKMGSSIMHSISY